MMFSSYAYSERRKDPGHGIITWFSPLVVVTDGPASRGPTVVELPHERSTTTPVVAPLLAPPTIPEHESFALYQLCEVDVCCEVCCRPHILHEISGDPTFMTLGLVVEIQHTALRVQAPWVFDEGLDGRQRRESLHAELGVESSA